MIRIHNPLGRPGSLAVKDVVWIEKRFKGSRYTIPMQVPAVRDCVSPQAAAIWNHYFDLLFLRYRLPELLTAHLDELKAKAGKFYSYLYPKGNELDRTKLLELLIGDPRKNAARKFSDGEDANEAIAKAFNYKALTGRPLSAHFGKLVQMLNVSVCPYCGRTLTTTVERKSGGYIRTNQVDHYFPKSVYPWLALSIWNFIPVCGPCNNRKQDRTDLFLYPYAEEMGDAYRFRTHPVKGVGYLVGARDAEEDFEVSLDRMDEIAASEDFCERAENEIRFLGVRELYSTHNAYVCNIFRQRYIFGTPYIDSLMSSFRDWFHCREDVRAMLYMKRVDAESIGNAPLDKLTRDIDSEIDELTEESQA